MDIVTAFAVRLRRIIFDSFDADESWLRKLAATGFSADDIQLVVDVVSDRSWLTNSLAMDEPSRFQHFFSSISAACSMARPCRRSEEAKQINAPGPTCVSNKEEVHLIRTECQQRDKNKYKKLIPQYVDSSRVRYYE